MTEHHSEQGPGRIFAVALRRTEYVELHNTLPKACL